MYLDYASSTLKYVCYAPSAIADMPRRNIPNPPGYATGKEVKGASGSTSAAAATTSSTELKLKRAWEVAFA